jgi:uncharacterized protein (TIRG00374 family)
MRAIAIGLVAGALFLGLALRKVNAAEVWATLRQLHPTWLLLALSVGVVNFFVRTWRWQAIFPRESRPPFWTCFQVLAISLTTNNFLPGRGGDVLRCVLVNERVSLSRGSLALATLGLEKVLDGLALAAVVLYACSVLTPPTWLTRLSILAGVLFGGVLAALMLLWFRAASCTAALRWAAAKLHARNAGEKVAALLQSFTEGLSAVGSAGRLSWLAAQTAVIWISEAALFWVLARSLDLDLAFSAAVVASAILGLGLMFPAAPGALGTYEFFSTSALRLSGMAASAALSLTLLLHAFVLVFTTGVGVACVAIAGFSLRQFRVRSEALAGSEVTVVAQDNVP